MMNKEIRAELNPYRPLRVHPMRRYSQSYLAPLCTFILGTAVTVSPPAFARCLAAEVEPNDKDTEANADVCTGVNVAGRITTSRDSDWFQIEVPTAGNITVNLSHDKGADLDWYLYPATGGDVAHRSTGDNPEVGSYYAPLAGTYYARVKSYSGIGSYTLTVTFPSGGVPSPPPPCTLPRAVDLGKVGNTTPKTTTPTGGFVLMGGGTDVDAAIQWMIARSGGGDAVILRSTGTNAYNQYMYDLGGLNSVQTLLITSAAQGNDACVAQTLKNAGMLFIAGGNQQNYVDYFKGTATGAAINDLIARRHAPVGGTSAGMAILGQYYHPGGAAEDSSVLQNPTAQRIGTNFLRSGLLDAIVTEPHFAQRSRQPRLTSFLTSMMYQYSIPWQDVRGIACDETTAYALEPSGSGKVFGTGACRFVRPTGAPEVLNPTDPLTWELGGQALSVCNVPGTTSGTNTFDVKTWICSSGAQGFWSIDRGNLTIH